MRVVPRALALHLRRGAGYAKPQPVTSPAPAANSAQNREGERFCIDVRVHAARQLFDGRDPAPFRERDLDEDAVAYIVDSAEDAPARSELKLVVWITDGSQNISDATIEHAVQAHFDYLLARLNRTLHKHVRQGQLKFLVGFVVLVSFLALSRLFDVLPDSTARRIVQEGLSIVAWVAMWRPLEVLLYDWWPLLRERRLLRRIRTAEVAVMRHASGSILPAVTP